VEVRIFEKKAANSLLQWNWGFFKKSS